MTLGAAGSSAQDVADAARQERARKEAEHKKPKHVYTDEDLKRAQILTPEDRAELDAKKNDPLSEEEALNNLPLGPNVSASQLAPENFPNALPPDAPLGDVARYYRRWKISQALRREQQFPLEMPKAPVLASPKPMQPLEAPLPHSEPAPPRFDPTQRLMRPSRVPRTVANPVPPEFMPFQPPVKRSPFARPKLFTAEPPRVSSSRPVPPSLASRPPVAPVEPARPFVAGNSSKPIAPANSSKPLTHVNPPAIEGPLRPSKPLVSSAPVAPVEPSKPFVAGNPSKPVAPANSSKPLNQVNPPVIAAPLHSSKPLASSTPVAPVEPPKPFVAGNLSKPVAPANSSKPLARVNPPAIAAPLHPTTPLASASPSSPAAPAVSPKTVAPASGTLVKVQPGDSLWKLAEQHLGQGLRWHELLAANPNIRDANHIEAGSHILLPAAVSSSRTVETMTVQKGDSLWKIALARFGQASSWACIAHANPAIADANLIYAGQTLTLPANCKR